MSKTLINHGNSQALVIDKPILELLQITADTPLELTTNGDAILITPIRDKRRQRRREASLAKINEKFGEDLERLAQQMDNIAPAGVTLTVSGVFLTHSVGRITCSLEKRENTMRHCVTLVLLCVALCGCGKPVPETLVQSGYDEMEMQAAIARARKEVDSFIRELANPTGTDHAVKAAIVDKGQTEHFWLTEVVYQNGEFKGKIGNDPGIVTNVKVGQPWTVKKDEISDWMYMGGAKMHGNYTMRPLLKTMPAEEAESLRAMLAEP